MEHVYQNETTSLEQNLNNNFSNTVATSPIGAKAPSIIKEYINFNTFDKEFEQAICLMGGDKLLAPRNAIVRKTSTEGVYKVIYENGIKILDESQLFSNKKFAAGSVSKLSEDEFEVISFDEEDNMEINHLNKGELIYYMNKNKLAF